jgi:hypothetical protein
MVAYVEKNQLSFASAPDHQGVKYQLKRTARTGQLLVDECSAWKNHSAEERGAKSIRLLQSNNHSARYSWSHLFLARRLGPWRFPATAQLPLTT